MRNVILGTAGHIDHGKSSLVKALTGIDPDRLKEEKERGITIDLGFANLDFPEESLTIGIVDVPGHERLVRNMLAGAGGIDLVLLVIAAEEGIMPQTREHMDICGLLKIKSGIVALTKSDLVERDWLGLVTDDIRGFIKGTFLEGAEIVPVSSKTGENLGILKEKIKEAALKTEAKPSDGLFRLPIDRVFTLKGFGTVVTGTAISGTASNEETLEILPGGQRCKLRGIHSHGKSIKKASAGQRAALNLQGIEKEELKRGDTLVSPGRFLPLRALDCSLSLLKDAPQLKNRSLVHFHIGTSETVARAVLYGKDVLRAEEDCYCQFRLSEPVVAQSGDRYIIRRFSPLVTIGGGAVIDPSPHRKRFRDAAEDLRVFEKGTLEEKLALKAGQSALRGTDRLSLEGFIKAGLPDIENALRSLKEKGILAEFENVIIHGRHLGSFRETLIKRLEEFHRKNPLKRGMPKEEIRASLRIEPRVFNGLISSSPEFAVENELIRLGSFKVALSEEEGGIKGKILARLDEKKFQPPTVEELASMFGMDIKRIKDILRLMAAEGTAVRMIDSIYISSGAYETMLGLLRGFFDKKPEMAVSEFRDLLSTTRKYALPFLEYLDSNKITLRVGDVRKSLLKGR